ncbi:MAG: Unknown protein [uncultured Sulfurovum sp.]|uniref:Fimbrial protein n=1 Tax=uncultured Sulfurovum sp. TaxID=269237 RepID=A0A6S6S6X1_9BACT|nr:MAG: Unknown protein [uncultured Sulfurovum sp.]
MKKLLSIAAIAALMSTGVQADANKIVVTATVNVDGYVGFASVGGSTLGGTGIGANTVGTFVDNALNAIAFGPTTAGTDLTAIHRDVFVKSNANGGVRMALDDVGAMVNTAPHAATADADEKIELAYTYAGTAIAANTPFTVLAAGSTNAGTAKVNADAAGFLITPAAIADLQVAGDYTKTVNVTIAVN